MKNKELIYLCIAAANKCEYIKINDNLHLLPANKDPQFKFTGNIFKLFPDLLEFAPLSENKRISLILTPIQKSWYFQFEGKEFNFYPLFLYLTRIRVCKFNEYTPNRKLDFYDCYNIQSNYKPINV